MKRLKLTTATLVLGSIVLALALPAFADVPGAGEGGLWNELTKILENVIDKLLKVGGVVALVFFIIGGVQYMMSGGDKQGSAAARSTITFSIVGLVLVVGAYLFLKVLFEGILKTKVPTPYP